jgi:hypothetical protein
VARRRSSLADGAVEAGEDERHHAGDQEEERTTSGALTRNYLVALSLPPCACS